MATNLTQDVAAPRRRGLFRLKQFSRSRVVTGLLLMAITLLIWQGRYLSTEFAKWRGRVAIQARRFDDADAWLQRADVIDPSDGEVQFLLARVERMRGRSDRMRIRLEKAVKAGYPVAILEREQILAQLQSGHMQQADQQISSLLVNPGDDGQAICEAIASGLFQAFRISEAMSVLEAWVRDYPADPQPFVVRGMYFSQRQSWGKAAQDFEKALQLQPTRTDVRLYLAEALRNEHQLDAARAQFELCRQAMPNNPAALIGLGRCCLESGDLDAAQGHFSAALQAAPDSWDARLWMGKLLAVNGLHTDALPYLEAVSKERPYEPDVRYTLALTLQAAGRDADARTHFDYVSNQQKAQSELRNKLEMLEREPGRVELRYEIGMTLLEYGNPVEGVGWLNSVLDLEPTHAAARVALDRHKRKDVRS